GVTGGVPAAADGDLVAGQRALLLGRVRGQVQSRGLGAGAVHHRHEVVAVRTDGRDPRGRALRLLRVAGSGRGLGGAGLRVAVTTAPAGTVRAAVAAGGRRDDPVVVTAAEGRTALLRGPPGLLRVGGRRRGPALEPLRSAGATGATMTAGTAGAAMTAGASVPAVVTGATVGARAGRGRCRTRRVAAEAVRARRDRLGGTVHLRGTRALVVEGVGAAAVRRAGLLPEGPAGALPRPLALSRSLARLTRRGRGVRGRRVGQEVPPALLAERRGALPRGAALRAQLRPAAAVPRSEEHKSE